MRKIRGGQPLHALFVGLVAGLVVSLSGLAALLWLFGFWWAGGLLLLITVPIALVIVVFQRGLPEALSLGVGTMLGLSPGLWFYARQTEDFSIEFGFPLLIGLGIALTVAPLFIRRARRRAKVETMPPPG